MNEDRETVGGPVMTPLGGFFRLAVLVIALATALLMSTGALFGQSLV